MMSSVLIGLLLLASLSFASTASLPGLNFKGEKLLPPNMTKYFTASVNVSYSSAKVDFVAGGKIWYDVTANKRAYQYGDNETGVFTELWIYHTISLGHNYTIFTPSSGASVCTKKTDFILHDVNMFWWLGLGLYNGTLDVDGTKCEDWISGEAVTPIYDVCVKPGTNIPVRYAIYTYAPMAESSTIFQFTDYNPTQPDPSVFDVPSVCGK